MALEIKLNQKLSQSLIMTPQLQQAIKLLQLGRTEYLEVIEKELLENPVLEDSRDESAMRPPAADEIQAVEVTPAQSKDEHAQAAREEEPDWVQYLDLYADSYSSSFGPARRADFDDERPSLEASLTRPEGLMSHLLWQIRTTELPHEDREIAIQLVGNLNHDGYLGVSLEEIALDCNQPVERVAQVLGVIQTLDPVGVGARDIKECLLIQLDQAGLGESLAGRIVRGHLPKLELRKYEQIAKEEGVQVQDVYDALRQIQKLEPRPGRPFVDEAPVYITPDIYVRKVDGQWVVSLNEAGMPRLRLNPQYRELLGNGASPSAKEYLQERLRSAAWLMKSVHQRQQTIYKVAQSIMRFQRDFLEQGISAMRPLVLRDVAEDVKMHESTVSRVTTNKYIHTPHGVYELKFFFSSGLRTEEGSISSESVKQRIREVIDGEDAAHPLSDQAIVEQLRSEGIDIARRTVAKYREMMNVLSSSRRKKLV